MTKGKSAEDESDAPLNLSMKSDNDSANEPPALTIKRKSSVEQDLLSNFTSNAKIPSDYYACKYKCVLSRKNILFFILCSSTSIEWSFSCRADSTAATGIGAPQSSCQL